MTQRPSSEIRRPTETDTLVGANVKRIRRGQRMSQSDLGAALSLSLNQIRKYEAGQNRISASTLYLMSKVLNVQVEDFFDGLETVSGSAPFNRREAGELCELFESIQSPEERKALLRLVKEVADSPLFR